MSIVKLIKFVRIVQRCKASIIENIETIRFFLTKYRTIVQRRKQTASSRPATIPVEHMNIHCPCIVQNEDFCDFVIPMKAGLAILQHKICQKPQTVQMNSDLTLFLRSEARINNF